MPSTLLLTPGFVGSDGLSCLSRLVASVLIPNFDRGEVWTLADREVDVGSSGGRVRPAGSNRVRYLSWVLAEALARQRREKVVVLHTHLAPLALPLAWRGARFVHVLVGIEAWKPLTTLQAVALRRADRLVSISRHSAVEFQRANPGFAGSNIVVCHPGLPDVSMPDEVGQYEPFALIVGRMAREERYKGHDLLLEIWDEFRRRERRAKLVVAGDGDDRTRLERKAIQLGLDDAVQFLGRVTDGELERLYRSCAFYVMPSRHEGFGFTFLEAMRAGKPCVAARGAASEIIEDGVSGFIVEPDGPSILKAIERLWNEETLRRDMGLQARRRFLEDFSFDRFRRRLESAVEF